MTYNLFGGTLNLAQSISVTAESLRAKRDRKSAILPQFSHFDPKFQVQWDVPHQ